MNRVTAATDRARVIELLRYVASFLTSGRARTWLPGVIGVLEVVEDDSLGDLEALKRADARYRAMFGPGGFDDFIIWRDDPDERAELNRQYDAATDELWRLLSDVRGSNQ
jgi:hypothetical protein